MGEMPGMGGGKTFSWGTVPPPVGTPLHEGQLLSGRSRVENCCRLPLVPAEHWRNAGGKTVAEL